MSHKLFLLTLLIGLMLVIGGVAMAQTDDDDDDMVDDDDDMVDDDDDTVDDDDDVTDDDDSTDDDDDDSAGGGFMDSTADFSTPEALEPSTTYDFVLVVTHGADAGAMGEEWINGVDLQMPSADYVVDEANLTGPTPLYSETASWDASFSDATISWAVVPVATSAAGYGDIREGDSLSFAFSAETDADANNTFHWTLWGDQGNYVEGDAVIGEAADDDDTDDDDDTLPDNGDDDDDDGCGC